MLTMATEKLLSCASLFFDFVQKMGKKEKDEHLVDSFIVFMII